MGIHDRDYMRAQPPGRRPSSGKGFSLDSGLLLGIALVALGFGALLFAGFKASQGNDPEIAYDPNYNGGYPTLNVHTATYAELITLPLMSDRIAQGIIDRREKKPFRLSEDLLEVPGIGEINLEMFRLYLHGFEDLPEERTYERPLGPPDA